MCKPLPRAAFPCLDQLAPEVARREGDRTGDARSALLADLATRCARQGFAIAYNMLGNRTEAEEAVQEALAHACEKIADLRDPRRAHAWFFRVVTTTCLGALRRRKRGPVPFAWLASDDTGGADAAVTEHAVVEASSDDPGADSALAAREMHVALLARLGCLARQQRTALVLRYGEELPVAAVAQLLGVEPSTAKVHIMRGLARLRDLLTRSANE
jgi:RNA polymerase sigma-70 factor (ECF subfamily)